ncbi:MAG: 1,4-alpha-glucan branching protein [Ilumatobacteraceae bacterium]|nr:1,4-alpha-glucan branching protein [Ilumatobacteraceae bacterium]
MNPRVWAPAAGRVSMVADGRSSIMCSEGDGWWSADIGITDGIDYGFVLDDDQRVLPDPRSRWQPNGVHEPSRWFDSDGFAWTDHQWTGRQLAGSVIYELHLGTFTPEGTLDSAVDRLDHLVELGVDAVELLPVNAFDGHHNWGYDGVLWYSVDHEYGGPAAYMRFVDACHQRGLAVVQDVVYNHLGPSGNFLPEFGPYLRDQHANTWGASINLDEPAVRQYIIDNATMWLRDYHVDGLRLDAVHALVDHSPTHILQQLSQQVDALGAFLGRPLFLIAESDLNDPIMINPREAGGYGLQGQWSDDFHHALHVALTGETFGYYADFEPLDALAKVYTHGFFHDGTYSSFRGRNHGSPIDVATLPASRLVVTNQNHDQIGNRAAGDRLSATLDAGQLAIAAFLTLGGPFTPMLFMGEEWGAKTPWQFFTAHNDPDLGKATADGRFEEFERMGWDPALVPDPQDPETFARSKLDWSEPHMDDHARLLALYRSVIHLRRQHPDLTDPRFTAVRVEFDPDARWMVLHRAGVSTAVNFAATPVVLRLSGDVLLASDDHVALDDAGLRMPGHSAAFVRR